jgi:tetratricopeptide (TPR) repeat protein/Tfp pilus assembly protein PilZ
MWFKRNKPYSRTKILEDAGKAQRKGRLKKAIAKYMILLKVDPEDYEVHNKIAPLLARKRRFTESWESFKTAGEGFYRLGFAEKAMSVYTQAAKFMPKKIETWEAAVKLQLDLQQDADALKTIIEGRRYFKYCNNQHKVISLLRKALKIDPWNFETTFHLAHLLVKSGNSEEAKQLLYGLLERERGRALWRTCFTILKVSPSLSSAWRCLRTILAPPSRESLENGRAPQKNEHGEKIEDSTFWEEISHKGEELDKTDNATSVVMKEKDSNVGDDKNVQSDTNPVKASKRVNTIIPVGFASFDGSYSGTMLNISESGAFIRYDNDLKPKNNLNVRFSLPGEKGIIEVKSKVLWVNSFGEKENTFKGMGVHFTNITPKDRARVASFVSKEQNVSNEEKTGKSVKTRPVGSALHYPEENVTAWLG